MTDQGQAAREGKAEDVWTRLARLGDCFTDASEERAIINAAAADHARLVGEVEKLIACMDVQQDAFTEGYTKGLAKTMAVAEAEHGHWVKESTKHKRPGGYRSDHAERDLERARIAQRVVQKIKGVPNVFAALDRTVPAEEGERTDSYEARGPNPFYTPTIMAAFRAHTEGGYGGSLPDDAFKLGKGQYADEPYYAVTAVAFRNFKAGAEWMERFCAGHASERYLAPPVPAQDVAGVEAGDLEALAELRFGVSLMPQKLVSVNGRIITVAQLDRILAALSAASPSQGVESDVMVEIAARAHNDFLNVRAEEYGWEIMSRADKNVRLRAMRAALAALSSSQGEAG